MRTDETLAAALGLAAPTFQVVTGVTTDAVALTLALAASCYLAAAALGAALDSVGQHPDRIDRSDPQRSSRLAPVAGPVWFRRPPSPGRSAPSDPRLPLTYQTTGDDRFWQRGRSGGVGLAAAGTDPGRRRAATSMEPPGSGQPDSGSLTGAPTHSIHVWHTYMHAPSMSR